MDCRGTMNDNTRNKYLRYRREHPWLSATLALHWAKAQHPEWEPVPNNYDHFTREIDGFIVKLYSEVESQCPHDGDMGHYVNGVNTDHDYEWGGNYPRPSEELPLRLPYTAFASGAYSQD